VIAERDVGAELGLAPRRARVDGDQSRERIRAVRRALRTTQDFDALHVRQGRRHADTGEVDAVDEEAHRRVRRALPLRKIADAAQLEIAWPRGSGGPVEVRHEAEHVLEMVHARDFECLRSEHRRARRQIPQFAIAQFRGDHDLFERWIGRRGRDCHKQE
jgi:hypothetical protein